MWWKVHVRNKLVLMKGFFWSTHVERLPKGALFCYEMSWRAHIRKMSVLRKLYWTGEIT